MYKRQEEIDRQWRKLNSGVDILIQVNLGEEETKSGTTADELLTLVSQVARLEYLRIRGLMTLPPWHEDPEAVRPYFRQLKELAEQVEALCLPNVNMAELSMGMSHDFAAAIEEGATMVRVGTAIFGER